MMYFEKKDIYIVVITVVIIGLAFLYVLSKKTQKSLASVMNL